MTDGSQGDATDRDLALLQGSWEQVAMEEDGVCDPPDSFGAQGARTAIAGNGFSVRTAAGLVLLEGVFELDAET